MGARTIVSGILVFITAVLIAAVLTGCWHGTGKVVRRDYHPSWSSITTHCHTVGKSTVCLPATQYYPQSWSLLIRDSNDGAEHWVSVNVHDYNTHQINDQFSN